jgi:uncharacterized protein (DUF849 family)
VTPAALAADARRVVDAGAVSLHVHPRNEAGRETFAPEPVAAALTAIREACPGVEVGISTAASIEPDLPRRLALIDSWTVLPDFVSANLSEAGIEQVMETLAKRGVGFEAGIWSAEDARYLLTLTDVPWVRLLLEPWETDTKEANAIVDAIQDVLGDALAGVPRLVHGPDGAAWALLKRAIHGGQVSRVGLEDTLMMPDGTPAPDNAALVRAAKALTPLG